ARPPRRRGRRGDPTRAPRARQLGPLRPRLLRVFKACPEVHVLTDMLKGTFKKDFKEKRAPVGAPLVGEVRRAQRAGLPPGRCEAAVPSSAQVASATKRLPD